jgi:hypothetical protein
VEDAPYRVLSVNQVTLVCGYRFLLKVDKDILACRDLFKPCALIDPHIPCGVGCYVEEWTHILEDIHTVLPVLQEAGVEIQINVNMATKAR